MLDRFALWWCRTWLLWCLTLTLIGVAVPAKTFQVSFEALTGEALWKALADDMDVGDSVQKQAKKVVGLVPVDDLQALQPMLGQDRVEELVQEAREIKKGVAQEVGEATTRSVDKVVSKSVPRFLMGEDLTGGGLSDDLMLDLRPVRDDLTDWLTKAGRLIVDAMSEAIQANITAFMAPAVSDLTRGREVAEIQKKLMALELTFEGVGAAMSGVSRLIEGLSDAGLIDDEESAEATKHLTKMIQAMADMGGEAVQRGRSVLSEAEMSTGEPDWDQVVDRITKAMIEEAIEEAKAQSDVFAENLTQAIIGDGAYRLPGPVKIAIIEQLRPAQIVMAPIVTGGRALNTILLALCWTTVVTIVLVAGRTRRVALWLGSTGVVVGYGATLSARTLKTTAVGMAEGLGAMGLAVEEAGQLMSKMLGWGWGVVRFFLDMEPIDTSTFEGWNTQDVLNSAVFGVFEQSVVTRLSDWGSSLALVSLASLGLWFVLVVLEWFSRRRPSAAHGTLTAVLQQPGGMRLEDPLLMLIPRRGTISPGALPHAASSRLLVRGVFIDLSWLLLALLSTFTIVASNTLMVVGPMGVGGTVTPISAMTTAFVVGVGLLTLRLIKPAGRTVSGALSGEIVVDAAGQTASWRLRSLLAQLPWLMSIVLGCAAVMLTHSAGLGMGLAIGLLMLMEIMVIVFSGGKRTLGTVMMGRQVQAGGYGITQEDRRTVIRILTHIGTLWSLAWGLLTVGFFGMGLYALCTGIATAALWFTGRNGPPRQRQTRICAFLRLGNWMSLDIIGMALGIATLWLLQDDEARAYFASAKMPSDARSLTSMEE